MGDEKTTRRPRWQEAEAEMADILYWATMRQRLQRASEALARERRIFNSLAQARKQTKPPKRPQCGKGGRPPKVTPEIEQKIDDLLAAGQNKIAATILADLPKGNLNNPRLDTLRDHVQRRRKRRRQQSKKRAK